MPKAREGEAVLLGTIDWNDARWDADDGRPNWLAGAAGVANAQREQSFIERLLAAKPRLVRLPANTIKLEPGEAGYAPFDFIVGRPGERPMLIEYKRIGRWTETYEEVLFPQHKFSVLRRIAKRHRMKAYYVREYDDGSCWSINLAKVPEDVDVDDIQRHDRPLSRPRPHLLIPFDLFVLLLEANR